MEGSAKISFACYSLSNVFGNRFWIDFGFWLEAILGPNGLSEATSKASVIKYANQEGPRSINYPPLLKFSVWGPSVRGKQGEPHRPRLPLTGSADTVPSDISLSPDRPTLPDALASQKKQVARTAWLLHRINRGPLRYLWRGVFAPLPKN